MNPLMSMWVNPRPTIRAIVNSNPNYGVFYLSWIYALQCLLFLSSYWSFGLTFSFSTILIATLMVAPFFGWIWVHFSGWVLHFTGEWLGGNAPMAYLRAAAAWSKIPSVIALGMWIILMITNSQLAFINGVSGTSALFINFISFILGIWSIVLLIQSVREVQGFSALRATFNIFILWIISWIASFFFFLIFRYVYISF